MKGTFTGFYGKGNSLCYMERMEGVMVKNKDTHWVSL